MNQKLIKQVQEGTHCIEFNLHKDSPETLRTVTKQVWSNALAQPKGTEEYYFNFIDPQHWDSKTTLPSNLTPIPLDDFFKDEWCSCEKLPFIDCTVHDNPPTPEQPLPEELVSKHLEKFADDCCAEIFINGNAWIQKEEAFWHCKNEKITTQKLIELFFKQSK